MESKAIFDVAIMMFGGLAFGRLAKLFKLPNVTGYLIAGLIFGPSLLGLISPEMVNGFGIISDMALAYIAFSVGCEFSLDYFKHVGIAPIIIAFLEAFGAIILVTVVCILCGFDVELSIMLGAIAAATAPAQTIMVINQYKSKGALTSMLLSVVAIDDAVALIGFGFASTIVNTMNATKKVSIALSLLQPVWEIVLSVLIGFVMAIAMKIVCNFFHKASNRSCVIMGFVLGTYWLADFTGASPLMACMSIGAVLVNIIDEIEPITEVTNYITPPIFMIFFIISGAGFEISALPAIGVIGVIYVVVRVVGKMLGAFVGGKLTHQPKNICKWLGPTLMPQAGVALGLIVIAGKAVPDYAGQIRTVILCSTFIYSVIGPVAAKFALVKGGDIKLPAKN